MLCAMRHAAALPAAKNKVVWSEEWRRRQHAYEQCNVFAGGWRDAATSSRRHISRRPWPVRSAYNHSSCKVPAAQSMPDCKGRPGRPRHTSCTYTHVRAHVCVCVSPPTDALQRLGGKTAPIASCPPHARIEHPPAPSRPTHPTNRIEARCRTGLRNTPRAGD